MKVGVLIEKSPTHSSGCSLSGLREIPESPPLDVFVGSLAIPSHCLKGQSIFRRSRCLSEIANMPPQFLKQYAKFYLVHSFPRGMNSGMAMSRYVLENCSDMLSSCIRILKALSVPLSYVNVTPQITAMDRHTAFESPRLTRRENEVVYWLYLGKSNWEISRILGVSEPTIKTHIANILKKLNVRNRGQAIVRAMEVGILPIHPSKDQPKG